MDIMKSFGRGAAALGVLIAGIFLAGCLWGPQPHTTAYNPLGETNSSAAVVGVGMAGGGTTNIDLGAYTIQVGDSITATFSDVTGIPSITDTIKDDGTLTLIYSEKFQAAGKTVGKLQQEIHDRYVPAYFKYLTITVTLPARFFTVSGEVRTPNRFAYVGRTTLTQAITIAGGFTDFAKKSDIRLIRANGMQSHTDYNQALGDSALDPEIYPGDQIIVKKRFW
jgi:protein involved in polysaccharide export with SLBB domain